MATTTADTAKSTLDLRCLGPFEAQIEGQPLRRLHTHKGRWLLALLALRHERHVEREWLAAQLWSDSGPAESLANLRNCLYDLRKALGPEAVRLRSPSAHTVCLDLAGACADVVLFDAEVKRGDKASLERAVGLYRGPLLEGCTEEWVFVEREAREQAYLAALETLAQAGMQAGNHGEAARLLRRAVQTDPLRESTRRGLMEALDADGDFAASIQAYRELRLLLRQEMNVEPDPETTAVYQRIRERARCSTRPAAAQFRIQKEDVPRIPCPLTELIGRDSELCEIKSRMRSSRLVTLTGAGGVGKTRLAIQVSADLESYYGDGVWYVELAGLADPALIPLAVASTLNIREEAGRTLCETLTDSLRSADMLLALDNCEHLLQACAELAGVLLTACPGLRILATSRQPLGIVGETTYRVPSLSIPNPAAPSTADALSAFDSIRLFTQRAAAVQAGFALTDSNVAAVSQVCRRLDGIPLAIELAAGRVTTLSVERLAERLDDRFALLTGGSRTALPRHQTLRALIDWSYDLLSPEEKGLLQQLSVFAGGWTLEAAETVCECVDGWVYGCETLPTPTHPHTHSEVIELLGSLVQKSLVVYEERESKERYRLLETVRQYAAEKLAQSGFAEIVRDRHLAYFLTFAVRARAHLAATEQMTWLALLDVDLDNLRSALNLAAQPSSPRGEESVRMCSALARYWMFRGHCEEGRRRCEEALRMRIGSFPELRARLLVEFGYLLIWQEDFAAVQVAATESLGLGRQTEDITIIAESLWLLSTFWGHEGDWPRARILAEECLEVARKAGSPWVLGLAFQAAGVAARNEGVMDRATDLLHKSVAFYRECGDGVAEGYSLNNLAGIAYDLGHRDECGRRIREALVRVAPNGDRRAIAFMLNGLAQAAAGSGEWRRAANLAAAARSLLECIGSGYATSIPDDQFAISKRREFGEAAFSEAWAEGRAMTMEQAIELAMSPSPSPTGAEQIEAT